MVVTYVNRKDKTYYLHQGTTKTGKPKYTFSQSREGDLVDAIPEGYEIYENPRGQVFLSKIKPQIITDEEIATVKAGMEKYCDLKHFIIDVKKGIIFVHTANQDIQELVAMLAPFSQGAADKARMQKLLEKELNYSAELRFVLIDQPTRTFQTERYCYLGAIDDWIPIGKLDQLPALVKAYVKHLGKESFFELD